MVVSLSPIKRNWGRQNNDTRPISFDEIRRRSVLIPLVPGLFNYLLFLREWSVLGPDKDTLDQLTYHFFLETNRRKGEILQLITLFL